MIQSAGAHSKKDLVGFDGWLRDVLMAENFRTAVFVDSDGFHMLFMILGQTMFFVVCQARGMAEDKIDRLPYYLYPAACNSNNSA